MGNTILISFFLNDIYYMHKKYDRGSSSYFLTLSLAVLDVKIDGLVLND